MDKKSKVAGIDEEFWSDLVIDSPEQTGLQYNEDAKQRKSAGNVPSVNDSTEPPGQSKGKLRQGQLGKGQQGQGQQGQGQQGQCQQGQGQQGQGQQGQGQQGQGKQGQLGQQGQRGQMVHGESGQLGQGQRAQMGQVQNGQLGQGQRAQMGQGQNGQLGQGQRAQVGQVQQGQVGQGPSGQVGQGQSAQIGQGQNGQLGQGQRAQMGQVQQGQVGQGPSGQVGQGQSAQLGQGQRAQMGQVQQGQLSLHTQVQQNHKLVQGQLQPRSQVVVLSHPIQPRHLQPGRVQLKVQNEGQQARSSFRLVQVQSRDQPMPQSEDQLIYKDVQPRLLAQNVGQNGINYDQFMQPRQQDQLLHPDPHNQVPPPLEHPPMQRMAQGQPRELQPPPHLDQPGPAVNPFIIHQNRFMRFLYRLSAAPYFYGRRRGRGRNVGRGVFSRRDLARENEEGSVDFGNGQLQVADVGQPEEEPVNFGWPDAQ